MSAAQLERVQDGGLSLREHLLRNVQPVSSLGLSFSTTTNDRTLFLGAEIGKETIDVDNKEDDD